MLRCSLGAQLMPYFWGGVWVVSKCGIKAYIWESGFRCKHSEIVGLVAGGQLLLNYDEAAQCELL